MTARGAGVSTADILVAEDERIVARHITEVLQRGGYRVPATVATGEAALAKASELRHDQAGQLLASLHFDLEEVGSELQPAARDRIPQLRSMVDEVEQQLRRISHEMRPPQSGTLVRVTVPLGGVPCVS